LLTNQLKWLDIRNPKLQKKAIDYTLSKATPFIQKTGSDRLDKLSTKIRPNNNYKTDRKDLDGGAIDVQNLLNQKWLPEKVQLLQTKHQIRGKISTR